VSAVAAPASALDDVLRAEVKARFGAVRQAVAVGSRPGTWIIVTERRRLVAKTMRDGRTAGDAERLEAVLGEAGVPRAPLLGCAEGWAFFAWVPGTPPRPGGEAWVAAWKAAFALLGVLREIRAPLAGDPGARWLARAAESAGAWPAAAAVLALLRADSGDEGPRSLAHGDFAPQNFLDSPSGLVLVDWEEAGTAEDGFDAG